jgi:CubicO group peptidase (beta-lactamase class C family)
MTYRRFLPSALCVIAAVALTVAGCAHKYAPVNAPGSDSGTGGGPVPGPGGAPQSCSVSSPSPLPSPVASLFTAAIAQNKGVPGGAIGFYQAGTAYVYYWGYANQETATCMGPDSIMELGSLTKTFTAMLVAQAYNAGLISASDNPATDIDTLSSGNTVGAGCATPPPATPVPPADYGDMAQMTISMLTTHTSGLPDTPPGVNALSARPCYSPNQLVQFVETFPSPSPPSPTPHAYLYSNVGFGTLGYVIQGVYKKDWFTVTKEKILTPLGMSNTYDVGAVPSPHAQGYNCDGTKAVEPWPLDAWPAAGALRSTLPDMMKYLAAAMQQSGTPASISQAMATAETPVLGIFTDSGAAQGMAWATATEHKVSMISKDGVTDGFNSWIGMVAPVSGAPTIGVVVLTNRAPVDPTPSPDAICAPYLGAPADRIGIYVLENAP